MTLTPPLADRRQHAITQHGITRQDPYAWLRADNWQEVMQAPETLPGDIRGYLEAENAYFKESFEAPHADLVETIYREIRGRIKEDETDLPDKDGPWAYNSRHEEGKQYPLIVRTPRDGGPETLLLDCNAEAGDGYFGFGGAEHSPDHSLLAWAADTQGSEYYTIHIRDIAAGTDTGEIITEAGDGGTWAPDGKSLYYTELDESHRPYRIRRHILGTPQSEDVLVYEEKDIGFYVGVGQTQSSRFITIEAHDHQTTEIHLIDADDPDAPPRLVEP
ncbi:MAG: S9 family peptidase, partial [Hyphomonadaceae bacterium]